MLSGKMGIHGAIWGSDRRIFHLSISDAARKTKIFRAWYAPCSATPNNNVHACITYNTM